MSGITRRFEEDGFIVLDNIYSDVELDRFKDTLWRIVQAHLKRVDRKCDDLDQALLLLEDIDHSHIADIYDTIAQTPALWRLAAKQELEGIINQLIPGPYYLYTNRCRIDMPRDNRRTYGWHQEVFYTLPQSNFVQTWSPVVRNATIANGTIEVCSGSHREGVALQEWNDIPGRATQIIVNPEVVAKYRQVQVEMQLGQVMIFSGRTFHRSGQNTSDEIRYSLIGMYHEATAPQFRSASVAFGYKGMTPREYYASLSKNR